MIIALGSTSDEKKDILGKVLSNLHLQAKVVGVLVNSNIPDQPLSEETTISGARNRAANALHKVNNCDLAMGLEGGLSLMNGAYYLVCVSVVLDRKGKEYLGVSGKLRLPDTVSGEIMKGKEFGKVIRLFAENNKNNANIMIINDRLINRKEAFSEAIVNSMLLFANGDYY